MTYFMGGNNVWVTYHWFVIQARRHILSAKMALLRPSTDIPHVDTQKDNLDWSVQNTIDGHEILCLFLKPSLYIFILSFGMHKQLCALQPACHTQLFALQPAYTLHTRVPFEQHTYHTRVFALQPTYTCIREFPLRNTHIIHEFPILIPAYTLIRH